MTHGTLDSYRGGCRCRYCCRGYRTAWERGETRLLSSARVRAHLERLLATGWTKRDIAVALGKHPTWITKLAQTKRRVQQATEKAVLALPLRSPRLERMLTALEEKRHADEVSG